MLLLLTVGN